MNSTGLPQVTEKKGRKESFSPSFCPPPLSPLLWSLYFSRHQDTSCLSFLPRSLSCFLLLRMRKQDRYVPNRCILDYWYFQFISKWILLALQGLQKWLRFCMKKKSIIGKGKRRLSTRKAGTAEKLGRRKGKTRKLANVVRESWGSTKGAARKDTINNYSEPKTNLLTAYDYEEPFYLHVLGC